MGKIVAAMVLMWGAFEMTVDEGMNEATSGKNEDPQLCNLVLTAKKTTRWENMQGGKSLRNGEYCTYKTIRGQASRTFKNFRKLRVLNFHNYAWFVTLLGLNVHSNDYIV